MWKRPDEATSPGSAQQGPGAPPPPPGSPAAPPPAAAPSRPGTGGARLGPTLTWEGKLAGEEDLLVEGRFKGEIGLPGHQVTIGSQGQVEGEVRASSIIVEGEVRGNLTAAQQVLVRASGKVLGDIRAPRVALDQGCRFKGAIDMEPKTAESRGAEARAAERRDERSSDRSQSARPNGERQAGERAGGADRATELHVEREAAAASPPAASARAGR